MEKWFQMAEPYRIKMVEKITPTTREYREKSIIEAGYNVFNLKSKDVFIDLLTDSGTSAMSDNQWAGIMLGDEAYAGCRNFFNLQESVYNISGYRYVLPTHQGRGAENILMKTLVKKGDVIPGNMHFDTTRGHMLNAGAIPLDLVIKEGTDPNSEYPFKGNIDLDRLEESINHYGRERIPFILLTVTCNNNGGQPVSMANIKATSEIAKKYQIPLFFDVARYAENCYFIKMREPGYQNKSILEIAKEMFSYGVGFSMSAKKDALVNIGGILATSDENLYKQFVQWGIVYEGFRTYGGLSGRDLEAMARGLNEALDDMYLYNRTRQVAYLHKKLMDYGIPVVKPAGGHAVYIDAKQFFPHIPLEQFAAQTLVVELYIEAGIRGVELGLCAFGERNPETGEFNIPPMEVVRLAIPRRVYTDRHMDVVAEACKAVMERRDSVRGLRLTYEAPILRHFTAQFERV